MLSDGWSTNGVEPKPPAAPHPHLCSTISVHACVCVALFLFRLWRFPWGYTLGGPGVSRPMAYPLVSLYRVARVLLERNKIFREDGNFYTSEAVLSRPESGRASGWRASANATNSSKKKVRTSQLISTRKEAPPGDLGLSRRYTPPE